MREVAGRVFVGLEGGGEVRGVAVELAVLVLEERWGWRVDGEGAAERLLVGELDEEGVREAAGELLGEIGFVPGFAVAG
ncbi:hypothetical protein [Actinocorallia sp. A-T 12471]|uniref:hypothetical protein n=1 Tax=Actinocorallia sp. A-T 12471 TaxID=3089813 RepID=UPI0029D365B1|nr:hypothetical protein [Actinocorallia sp. A-T 12471]MDX6738828.1 hypothetical protein [Actinocorallia sp. A-T 12471]